MTPLSTHPTVDRHQGSAFRGVLELYRDLYQSAGAGTRPRAPHPGDVLYWLGCAGVISALLFVATR